MGSLMAMISWDETVGALVTIVTAITGGVVAKDKYMQRRTSKASTILISGFWG